MDDRALPTLAEEIVARLSSSGGRPALKGATRRAKVPMDSERWAALTRLAQGISELSGRSVTPGQVAGHLLSTSIDQVRLDRVSAETSPTRRPRSSPRLRRPPR